jgi:quercetin dioxygenase-like cupin family protein
MKLVNSKDVSKVIVDHVGAKDVMIQWLIAPDDGAENFAMRLFEVAPGGHTPLHQHRHEHEVFVLQGQGLVTCDGEDHPIGPEDTVLMPGGSEHCFTNTGDSILRFLCLIPTSAC